MEEAFKKEILFKILVIGDFGVGKTSIIKRYAEGTFSPKYKITIGADFAIKRIEWDEDLRINLQLWDIAGHERFGSLTSVYYRYACDWLVFEIQSSLSAEIEAAANEFKECESVSIATLFPPPPGGKRKSKTVADGEVEFLRGHISIIMTQLLVGAAVVFDLTRPETFQSVKKWLTDLRDKITLPKNQNLPVILLANKADVTNGNLPSDLSAFCKQNNIMSWHLTSAKENINIAKAMDIIVRSALDNYQNNGHIDSDAVKIREEEDEAKNGRKKCCSR